MLFIKVENSITVDHPVTLENLMLVYPDFSANNTHGYAAFNRASVPNTSDPFILYETNYLISDNVVNEVYTARSMTAAEKQQLFDKMQETKPYASWILDMEKAVWQPPTPYPIDNNKYTWDENTVSWILTNNISEY